MRFFRLARVGKPRLTVHELVSRRFKLDPWVPRRGIPAMMPCGMVSRACVPEGESENCDDSSIGLFWHSSLRPGCHVGKPPVLGPVASCIVCRSSILCRWHLFPFSNISQLFVEHHIICAATPHHAVAVIEGDRIGKLLGLRDQSHTGQRMTGYQPGPCI